MKDMKWVRVFIATPSDIIEERKIVRQEIDDWNKINSKTRNIFFEAVGYEDAFPSTAYDRPQEHINKQFLEDSDVLVGIFCSRIGTPTGDYSSGTVEEIEKHVMSNKPAMLFFINTAQLSEIKIEQVNKLLEFKEQISKKRFYKEYKSVQEFCNNFHKDFGKFANEDEQFLKLLNTYGTNNKSLARPVSDNAALVALEKLTTKVENISNQITGKTINAQRNKQNSDASSIPNETKNTSEKRPLAKPVTAAVPTTPKTVGAQPENTCKPTESTMSEKDITLLQEELAKLDKELKEYELKQEQQSKEKSRQTSQQKALEHWHREAQEYYAKQQQKENINKEMKRKATTPIQNNGITSEPEVILTKNDINMAEHAKNNLADTSTHSSKKTNTSPIKVNTLKSKKPKIGIIRELKLRYELAKLLMLGFTPDNASFEQYQNRRMHEPPLDGSLL